MAENAGELELPGAVAMQLMQGVLERGASFRFRARGSSMFPFVRDGDLICVSPLDRPPRLGDVVAFVHPETSGLVVHRVVRWEDGVCILRGDNDRAGAGDGVSPDALLGRVTEVQRRGRRVRLGLGPERTGIALLSRAGRLPRITVAFGRLRRALP